MSLLLSITQETTATVDIAAEVEKINGDMGMLWMLIAGILVFMMQAGFTLVESGMTRSKNAVNIAMKNLLDICIGSIAYWFVGYSLMYGDTSNGWFFWSGLMQGEGADLFFQTMFAATAATIVSGAIAGRTKYGTYLIFSLVMTAIIYPISGGWQWQGDGWLTKMGFIDFAGSSIVHSVGGWAALVAAFLVGPRIGKYVDGKVIPIPGHNQILATLGVFILWFGWFGFNGGSQLAWGGADAIAASNVVLVTNLAAAAGGLAALITTWIWYGKPNLAQTLNGVLAGLVGITAGCGNMTPIGAIMAGFIAGIIVVFSIEFIEKKLKIDDAVGAVSVHGVAGAWGTLVIGLWGVNGDEAIGLLNGGGAAQLGTQAIGVLAYAVWAIVLSLVVFGILHATVGLRVSKEVEIEGLDISEHGSIAYPGKRQREIE
ncbi:MAG: ammonium transporter [Flavobacteriia bacterium]|nr:ammonium transporter [Flavobacteriia bacterium]OIP47562.1 MAG: ammonium transporter [Flavobacteriaceae bacterium CG2_30_31_66]PIV97981.1 MAG: ammonium transporter [Flavobacteriaceae bacterium CG17_big_fil_post_rev_8_21_14_2_50_31_13]PIX12473.1 MAG: ammonium transporter [Flavobacteriaceae bacterium CG_4_8_14_3_um_filter_31_8]PIY15826.1 MAG: ammonium transporter [Flavobacteriaceae bacterium CG_4_10_14_3_um_filter_31_253]PIZ09817.1 MAG: ammonium transporter [Flavobacteriaceae bacterium CG_4_10